MAELPEGFDPFFLEHEVERQEETAVGMLEDLERITGIPFGELLAEGIEPAAPEPEPGIPEGFVVGGPEDTIEDAFDSRNDLGDDLGDYLDAIFDESDIPGDELDAYAEGEV